MTAAQGRLLNNDLQPVCNVRDKRPEKKNPKNRIPMEVYCDGESTEGKESVLFSDLEFYHISFLNSRFERILLTDIGEI